VEDSSDDLQAVREMYAAHGVGQAASALNAGGVRQQFFQPENIAADWAPQAAGTAGAAS
jgi:hypothetical protein